MRSLETFAIRNFKSIRDQELHLRPLNIFIGGNGSGKSNLIGAFRFLKELVSKNLAGYTAQKGGADSLLYFGRRRSPEMEFHLEFGEGRYSNGYTVILRGTDDDRLVIRSETAFYHDREKYSKPYDHFIGGAEPESKLRSDSHISAKQILRDLEDYRVYHFHDTSDTGPLKGTVKVDDNRFLRPQAENLPAFLYWLQQAHPDRFRLIEDTIRQIAPFFREFHLGPSRLNESVIRLEWLENGSDSYFDASSLSDGTLRFICLATLLLQPELPRLILLDEPELGLHPSAITLLADLLSAAAERTQVMVATQSVTLVNRFDPGDVWVVDRSDSQSVFRRLSDDDMAGWLDSYALGELWEKNLLGGRP